MNVTFQNDALYFTCSCGHSQTVSIDDIHFTSLNSFSLQNNGCFCYTCENCNKMYAISFDKISSIVTRLQEFNRSTIGITDTQLTYTSILGDTFSETISIDATYNTIIGLFLVKNETTEEYGLMVINFSNPEVTEYIIPEGYKFIEVLFHIEIQPDKTIVSEIKNADITINIT